MDDQDKTRAQLLAELQQTRAQLARLEQASLRPDHVNREANGFFMGLLQHAPMAIYVKATDGRFLLVNRAWEDLFGLRQEAVVGRHVSELLPAATAEEFLRSDEPVIRTQTVSVFEEVIDFPNRRRYYHTVKFPLFDTAGHVRAVGGISLDITERKQTEQVVRASEERYRQLFERNLAGVYRASLAGQLLDCNDAFALILGYTGREDILAHALPELFGQPADWDEFAEHLRRQGTLTLHENSLRRPDGGTVHTLQNVSLSEEPSGPCVQGTLIDISERWRTRQELIQERHLLRTLMDNVPDLIYFKDVHSCFTRVNLAQANRLGLADPSQAVGRCDDAFFPAAFAQQTLRDEREVMRAGQPLIDIEEYVTWPNGRQSWLSTSKMPLRDPQDRIIGTFGISRDITERKRAEEALRQSEERHRLISKLASDYVYSVRFDTPPPAPTDRMEDIAGFTHYTLEWITEPFERVTGYTPAEVQARGGIFAIMHPDDLPPGIDFMRRLLQGERGEIVYRIVAKNGEVRWLRDYCQAVWDEALGRVIRLYGGVQDITERKRAEEALRESEVLYRVLFEQAPIGLGIADLDGNLIAFNDAILKPGGYTRADILQLGNVAHLYADAPERAEALASARQQGSLHRHEVRYKRKDGSTYRAFLDLTPVSVHGRPCWLAMVEDITERRDLEEQLRQAQKMEAIGQLAGGIAHDFNNLLTAILGNTSLLLAAVSDHEPNRDLLRDIERAAIRAAELTGQLLGFSRQTLLRLEPTSLNSIIRETVAILRWTIDPRITVQVQSTPGVWPVLADPGQMSQVLMNLCLNARDAMPQGGTLTLHADNASLDSGQARQFLDARPGEFVRLRVADTGSGIPPEIQPRIFDPFFTTKGPGKGTGLGLSMVFGIVKQHQGWIECASAVDHGTRFDIYLPRSPDRVVGTAPPSVLAAPGGGHETVLLVDDEAIIRNLGRTILQRYGYQVLLAEDGQDALELFQRRGGQIDLVILDLTMPRLSGRDTLRQLLQLDPQVRVLFSSGYSAEQMTEADRGGVLGFVNKPYRPQDLAQTVRMALDQVPKKG